MKQTILLILTLSLILGHTAYSLKRGDTAKITTNRVKLRTSPILRSKVILRLGAGDLVAVMRIGKKQTIRRYGTHRWYQVSFKGKKGWVYGAYLTSIGATRRITPTEKGLRKLQTWLKGLDKNYTIKELKNLINLDLSQMELKELAPEIGYLTNVQELYLDDNKFNNKEKIKRLFPVCRITFEK